MAAAEIPRKANTLTATTNGGRAKKASMRYITKFLSKSLLKQAEATGLEPATVLPATPFQGAP